MTEPNVDNTRLVSRFDGKDEVAVDAGVHAASQVSMASLDQSFARGIAWLGSVKWLVQLLTWGVTILVARILTPADYGLVSMAAVILVFVTLLSESGIGITVVTVRTITREQIAQLNAASVLLGIAGFAIAAALAFPMAWFYRQPVVGPVIIAASSTLIVASFRVVPNALLQRDLRFARVAVIDGIQGVIQALATISLAMLGFRYWSLVLGGVIAAVVSTAATVLARPFPLQRPRWDTLRPVLPLTWHVMFTSLFWYAYSDSDFIVAGRRLGSEALGAYSYAWTLASMPVDKITALVGGVTPAMFAAVQHDIAALRRYFLLVTEGLAAVAFPLTLGVALVAQDLVPAVFGARWTSMTTPLQILAAYASIRTIVPPANQVLVVTGDTRFQVIQNAIAALVFPTAFWFASRWGTLGIATAWAIVHPLVIFLPLHFRVLPRLELSVIGYGRALWPALSGCLLMAAAVVGARALVPHSVSVAIRLAIEVTAGAAMYSTSLLLLHRRRVAGIVMLWRRQNA